MFGQNSMDEVFLRLLLSPLQISTDGNRYNVGATVQSSSVNRYRAKHALKMTKCNAPTSFICSVGHVGGLDSGLG